MQPNTVNTHHDTSPAPAVPPDLLETVARALAAALVPPPRQPEPPGTEQAPDFLTAVQLAQRLGVSRETVRRLAIVGALPHTVVCRGAEDDPPVPSAVRGRVRGQRPGHSRPGRLRRPVAGAGYRARTVTAGQPRHRTPALPALLSAGWRYRAACRGADLDLFFPGRGESAEPARRICALCPVRQPCLDYALSGGIVHGIWGGLAERDRRALRTRHVSAARRERDEAIAAAASGVHPCGDRPGVQPGPYVGEPGAGADGVRRMS